MSQDNHRHHDGPPPFLPHFVFLHCGRREHPCNSFFLQAIRTVNLLLLLPPLPPAPAVLWSCTLFSSHVFRMYPVEVTNLNVNPLRRCSTAARHSLFRKGCNNICFSFLKHANMIGSTGCNHHDTSAPSPTGCWGNKEFHWRRASARQNNDSFLQQRQIALGRIPPMFSGNLGTKRGTDRRREGWEIRLTCLQWRSVALAYRHVSHFQSWTVAQLQPWWSLMVSINMFFAIKSQFTWHCFEGLTCQRTDKNIGQWR